MAVASPPTLPHPLSNHIPNLHGHPATEQKPHPKKNTSPPFQVPPPSVVNSIFSSSSVLSFVSAATAEKAADSCLPAATLPGQGAGPAPRLPLHPQELTLATYPGPGTAPQSLPEPLGLGSTLSFHSGHFKPQPICTQGYLQVGLEQDARPEVRVGPGRTGFPLLCQS